MESADLLILFTWLGPLLGKGSGSFLNPVAGAMIVNCGSLDQEVLTLGGPGAHDLLVCPAAQDFL